MSEKVVLPKFDLPGQGPHPAVKALWIVGALLGVSMLVFGAALWRHHSQQIAAEEAVKARAADAVAAMEAANAKSAAAAQKLAAAKAAAHAAPVAKDDSAEKAATVAAVDSSHKTSHHHPSSSHGKGKTLAAKTDSAKAKSTAASNKKKDDTIDKLLAQFK